MKINLEQTYHFNPNSVPPQVHILQCSHTRACSADSFTFPFGRCDVFRHAIFEVSMRALTYFTMGLDTRGHHEGREMASGYVQPRKGHLEYLGMGEIYDCSQSQPRCDIPTPRQSV